MRVSDLKAIANLQERCFSGAPPWTEGHLRSPIKTFPDGQIVVDLDGELVATSRLASALGARIFFVPSNTDIRQAHMRVRSCALARCIENHVYAGAEGNLPFTQGADIHYAESAALTQ